MYPADPSPFLADADLTMRTTLPYGLVPGTGFMRSDDKRDSRYNFRAALGQDMPGPLGYLAKFRKD